MLSTAASESAGILDRLREDVQLRAEGIDLRAVRTAATPAPRLLSRCVG